MQIVVAPVKPRLWIIGYDMRRILIGSPFHELRAASFVFYHAICDAVYRISHAQRLAQGQNMSLYYAEINRLQASMAPYGDSEYVLFNFGAKQRSGDAMGWVV